jgi:hypothetical protein
VFISKEKFCFFTKSEIEQIAEWSAIILRDEFVRLQGQMKSVPTDHPVRRLVHRMCNPKWDVHVDQWLPARKYIAIWNDKADVRTGIWIEDDQLTKAKPRMRSLSPRECQDLRAYECSVVFRIELGKRDLPLNWTGEEPVMTPLIERIIEKVRTAEREKKQKFRSEKKGDREVAATARPMSDDVKTIKIAQLHRALGLSKMREKEARKPNFADDAVQSLLREKDAKIEALQLRIADAEFDVEKFRQMYDTKRLAVMFYEGELSSPPRGLVPQFRSDTSLEGRSVFRKSSAMIIAEGKAADDRARVYTEHTGEVYFDEQERTGATFEPVPPGWEND